MTFNENNIIFNLESNNKLNIPIICEIWFDGCNSCLVNNQAITVCSELVCSENQNKHCLRYNNGH